MLKQTGKKEKKQTHTEIGQGEESKAVQREKRQKGWCYTRCFIWRACTGNVLYKRDIKVRLMVRKQLLCFLAARCSCEDDFKACPVVCTIKSTRKLERVAMKNESEEQWHFGDDEEEKRK